ncbi:MAG: endonuclease/exonuclease/phosphatase family protein [Planctomycetota bacterium]|nr:endonuclease/exonuclease/phosphatase family protein [Planctomycetota bacterium]
MVSQADHDSPPSRPWRIATWNIHGGKGMDRRLDLGRIVDGLRGYDFVGLNEVRGPANPWDFDQSKILGERLHSGWLFLPYERRFCHDDIGNGVVGQTAVTNWIRIPLPNTCVKGHGNVTLLTTRHFSQDVHVLVTHIDHKTDRVLQLAAVGEIFDSLVPPAILMGDLNTRADDPTLARILGQPGVVEPLSALGKQQPDAQIDWILVKGLACLDAGFEDSGASDHPLIWVELTPLNEPAATAATPASAIQAATMPHPEQRRR